MMNVQPEPIWYDPISLDYLNQRCHNTLAEHLSIRFSEIGNDYLCAVMPIQDCIKQPAGIMHGGASCVLAETVGSTAANCCVNQKTTICVGLDINTSHIKSIRSGLLCATATAQHLGRSTHVWSIDIIDQATGARISITRLTMAVLKKTTPSAS